MIRLIITLTICLSFFSNSVVLSQQIVNLNYSNDEPYFIFRNDYSLIRFSYRDVVREIRQLKKGQWFSSLESIDKEKIEKLHSELSQQHRTGLGSKRIVYLDANAAVDYAPLLTRILEDFIGASLLAKGNAGLWKRSPLKSIGTIELKMASGSEDPKTYFYFLDNEQYFFSGIVLKAPATVLDLASINLDTSREDSLLFNIKSATAKVLDENGSIPVYPNGIKNFIEYLKSNIECNEWMKDGARTYFVEFIVAVDGFISSESIKLLNQSREPHYECFDELRRLILQTERWTWGDDEKKAACRFVLPLVAVD